MNLTCSENGLLSLLVFNVSLEKGLAMTCLEVLNNVGSSEVFATLLDQRNGLAGDLTMAVDRKFAETID